MDFTHLVPCITRTSLKIVLKKVLEKLMKIRAKLGYRDVPAISSIDGKVVDFNDIDSLMLEILGELLITELGLFPAFLKDVKDLHRFYQCFRTLRKKAVTRATESNMRKKPRMLSINGRWWKDLKEACRTAPCRNITHS